MSTRKSQRNDRSAALGNTRRTQAKITRKDGVGGILTGTTISFTSPNTISDSGNNLAQFNAGATIRVRCSAKNSRVFHILTSAAGTLTTRPSGITSEVAGPTITITREE